MRRWIMSWSLALIASPAVAESVLTTEHWQSGASEQAPQLLNVMNDYSWVQPACEPGVSCRGDLDCQPWRFPAAGGFFHDAELLFFRYHRADGNRSGNYGLIPVVDTDDVDADYQAAFRGTLGYRLDSGLGFRTRYFYYDTDAPSVFPDTVGGSLAVETYTIDMELFDRLDLGPKWALEFSGGVRYNEFTETMENFLPAAPLRFNEFRGFGGILGAEAQRSFGNYGGLFVRGRGSILYGDKEVINGAGDPSGNPNEALILQDSVVGVTELAAGFQYTRPIFGGRVLANLRTGYEWQLWHNYSSAFSRITSVPNYLQDPVSFGAPSDVALHGFTLGLGFSY